jgi:pimeloyl-ACP methyl ester carboxylesterase
MLLEELQRIIEKERAARKQTCIRCCMASGCMSSRSDEIKDVMQRAVVEKIWPIASRYGGWVAWDFAARARW